MKRNVYLIGNAHLDVAWMWRWQEGLAEVKATFRSALDRMKEFEDFKFTSAASIYYMWIEKSDPKMFDEIVARVKEGRWCIAGAWLVQPDCNIPCGESFARHSLIGQRYFKEKFGIMAKTGYNVDSFGHNGSIPKILKNSRMDNYVFMRPMEGEKELPQSLFYWESMDGSRVATYRIPFFYNIDLSRFEFFNKVEDKEEPGPLMAFYGVGNHGGGPTVKLLEKMKNELGANYIYSTPDDYFDIARNDELPVVTGDLQFHAKGCYSAVSKIKKANRKAENSLLDAEMLSVISNKLHGTVYPSDEFNRAWKNTLFNQFHDVLGGCSLREVYDDAYCSYGEAINTANICANFAVQQISWNIDTSSKLGSNQLPVVVFNPSAVEIETYVKNHKVFNTVTDCNGNEVASQKVRDDKTDADEQYATVFSVKIPPLGYSTYWLSNQKNKDNTGCVAKGEDCMIENSAIRLTANKNNGELTEIFIKDKNVNLLSGETSTILIDETKYDTWAHGMYSYDGDVISFDSGTAFVTENGPVRSVLRSIRKYDSTTVTRDYIIENAGDSVTVKTKLDFREHHKTLKFVLPINCEESKAFSKIPFGYIERPVDGSEQACGEWFALKNSNDLGVVIATDSKHSFSANKSELGLTVARGALYADHYGFNARDMYCEFIDQGEQYFEYTISPFKSFSDAEKVALRLNHKPIEIQETYHNGDLKQSFSGFNVSADNIAVSALKKHEDSDAIVLRCYEAEDKETTAEFNLFGITWSAHFGHNEVKTFIIDGKSVVETDFLEMS